MRTAEPALAIASALTADAVTAPAAPLAASATVAAATATLAATAAPLATSTGNMPGRLRLPKGWCWSGHEWLRRPVWRQWLLR